MVIAWVVCVGAPKVIDEKGTAVGFVELRENVIVPMEALGAAEALPDVLDCGDALEAALDAEEPEAEADAIEEEELVVVEEVDVPSRTWCLTPAGPWAAASTGRARAETRVNRIFASCA